LYNASHGELVDGYNYEESQKIIWDLIDWATQDKYVFTMNWESRGDMIMVRPLSLSYPRTLSLVCVECLCDSGIIVL